MKISANRAIKYLAAGLAGLCLLSGAIYLTHTPVNNHEQLGIAIDYEGIYLYYEKVNFSRLNNIMLKSDVGEKIEEFSSENIKWYKLKGADSVEAIIMKEGDEISEWKFVNYSVPDNTVSSFIWVLNKIYNIKSPAEIKKIMINDETVELNDEEKEKLYNIIGSMAYPQTEEDFSVLEDLAVKINSSSKLQILNFDDESISMIYEPESRILKVEKNAYSFFTVLSEDDSALFSNKT